MPRLVRVRLPNGTHATVGEAHARRHGYQVLDQPARDHNGHARPHQPHLSVAAAVTAMHPVIGDEPADDDPQEESE